MVGLAVIGAVALPAEVTGSPPAVLAQPGGPAAPAAAAAGRVAASASPASTHPAGHFNVGAAHSPRLLRQLAGPAGTSGPVINGPLAAATTGPVNGAAQGVDVASFQHPKGAAIDWQQVAGAGIKFAAVKVTEGAYYTNPYAASDLTDAKAAGLTTVGYAFAIPNGGSSGTTQFSADPKVQADDLISGLPSPMPVMLDIEYDPYAGPLPGGDGTTGVCYGLSKANMVSWIASFDAEVRAKTGRLPVIYTTKDWWSTCTGGSTAFGQTPVWPADYSSSGSPALPAGWSTWNLWQYSSSGTVTGISGSTDLDQLNPGVITLLNGGGRTTVAGSTIMRSQVTPFTVAPAPSLTYGATGLPVGLSIDPSTGVIAGWPDKAGTYHPVVTATGSSSTAGSAPFTWTVTAASTSGPTGPVRLDVGGKCLDDYKNLTSDGNKIDTRSCSGSAQQAWTVVQDGTLRIHGKCLHVVKSGTANGTLVNLLTCNGSAGEQWQVGTGAELVNRHSGKCLAGSGTTDGKQVWIWSCTGKTNQRWALPAGPVISGIPGKCLDDSENSTVAGTKIVTSACNGSTEQNWGAKPDGTIRIHSKCVTVNGSGAELDSCNGSAAQQWQITADGSGTMLENLGSGCLAYQGDGEQAAIASCATGDPTMTWRVR